METNSTTVKANGLGAPAIDSLLSPPVTAPSVTAPSVTMPPVTTSRPSVDPHSLAHKQLSKVMRAILGAEILDGRVLLMNPTVTMVVQATGVSASLINAARRLSPKQRQDAARGLRPLVEHRAAPTPVQRSVEQRLSAIIAELGGVPGLVTAINQLGHKA